MECQTAKIHGVYKLRIITGSARGRKLITLEGLEVRPTKDNVKEAMFSAIQFEIEGRVVADLFAGSGQLGLETLSRGAKKCYFVDLSAGSIKVIRKNIEHTGFADKSVVKNGSAVGFLRTLTEKLDIAILDAPYDHGHLQKVLPVLIPKMSEVGVVVCEHEVGCRLPEEIEDFAVSKRYKYGRKGVTIYRRRITEEDTEEA
jgi:16S rRNA (guanine(966)-N(2))-methyltransferase RsmD